MAAGTGTSGMSTSASRPGKLAIQRAARSVTNAVTRRCGEGPQVVSDVLVDKTGAIVMAMVDAEESRLGRADPACVEAALLHVRVPAGVSREGKATVSLRLR